MTFTIMLVWYRDRYHSIYVSISMNWAIHQKSCDIANQYEPDTHTTLTQFLPCITCRKKTTYSDEATRPNSAIFPPLQGSFSASSWRIKLMIFMVETTKAKIANFWLCNVIIIVSFNLFIFEVFGFDGFWFPFFLIVKICWGLCLFWSRDI